MSGDYLLLPPEIWYQVLTKLPVKSVLRCRCVCRTWYSLISCPNFVPDHTAQTVNGSTPNRVLVHHSAVRKLKEKFTSHDKSFVESHEHDEIPKPFLSSGGVVDIVSSCDGLVCLSKRYAADGADGKVYVVYRFLIWNPSIRKLVELPSRSSPVSADTDYLLGFGFDSNSSDYKLVRVGQDTFGNVAFAESEILDLRKGVWRSLSPTPMRPCLINYFEAYSSRCLYGNLHWIGSCYDLNDCILLSFNLSSEALFEMGLPDGPAFKDMDSDYYGHNVLSFKGLLSVAVLRAHRQDNVCQKGCWIWSMKEYGVTESWTKLFYIDLTCYTHSVLRFGDNDGVLILDKDYKWPDVLALYNPDSRESKDLLSAKELEDMCFYNESLVLL